MRRRSNSHSPISLFTFLDTLVCTMGSLILMLLAMTPKIRERAEARELARLAAQVQSAPQEVIGDPEPLVAADPPAAVPAENDEELAEARQRRRDAWLRSVADAREAIAARQAEWRRQRQLLKDAMGQLKTVHDQILKARLKEESVGDATQTLSELETRLADQEASITQKIALTRKNLELLNRRQTAAANEYALVPYDGTSGTVRRPIYIECSRKGFRFLPEDETLSPVDLKEFQDNDNPLLNGTKTLLRFWKLKRRESGGAEPEPYVLLLVRPSGCLNYYVARGLLSSLGANFGYELIEEDWKLSIPEPDPVAKTVLKQTLDMTVQHHGQVKDVLADAAVRGRFGSSGRNSGRGGGIDDELSEDGDDLGMAPYGADRGGKRRPGARSAPQTGPYRETPGAAQNDDSSTNPAEGSGTGVGTLGRKVPGKEASEGGPGGSASGPGRAAGMGGGTKPGAVGHGGAAGEFGGDGQKGPASRAIGPGGSGNASETGDDMFASRRPAAGSPGGALGADGGSNSGEAPGSGGAKAALGSSSGSRGATGRGGPGRGGARPATIGGGDADMGDGSGDGDRPLEIPLDYTPRKLPAGDGSGGIGELPMPTISDGPEGASGAGASGSGGKTSSAGGQTRGNSKSGSRSAGSPSSGSSSAESDDSGASSSGMADSGSEDSSGGASPFGKVQMGGPGASIRLGSKTKRKASDKDDEPDSGPRIAEEEGKPGGEKVRSRGPRLWGRARPKASIGLERKLEIRVLSDRILVGSKDISIPVGNGETTAEMINHVAAGIDHVADKWGEPPASFYWVPTVKFVVYPGANVYYERLRGPLEKDWGITSVVEYAPDKKPAKDKGALP